jgi:hypothetical protein
MLSWLRRLTVIGGPEQARQQHLIAGLGNFHVGKRRLDPLNGSSEARVDGVLMGCDAYKIPDNLVILLRFQVASYSTAIMRLRRSKIA